MAKNIQDYWGLGNPVLAGGVIAIVSVSIGFTIIVFLKWIFGWTG
jgi:hypothetical protein